MEKIDDLEVIYLEILRNGHVHLKKMIYYTVLPNDLMKQRLFSPFTDKETTIETSF